MKGSDLRCPTCQASAIDVAHDLDMDSLGLAWSVSWHCANGHLNISGYGSERAPGEFAQRTYPMESATGDEPSDLPRKR
jgi:hypothetical protein